MSQIEGRVPIVRDGLFYMDAVITPNRSLSERGFVILISVVTFFNCAAAAVFIAMGAIYVPFFLGLDVLAILLAFMASYRSARRVERVQVTPHAVRIVEETPKYTRVLWESPTAFTRVSRDLDHDDTLLDVQVAMSGKVASVARALSPGERADFAQALERAIYDARMSRG